MAQEELAQPMTSPQQVRVGIFACPQQIAQALPLRVRYRHER